MEKSKSFQFCLLAVLFLLLCFGCRGEENYSCAPSDSRFEIVESHISGAISILKIDKYSGNVYELFLKEKKEPSWNLIVAEESEEDTITANKNSVNYQVFNLRRPLFMTFLLNINTGLTWQLTNRSKDNKHCLYWEIINKNTLKTDKRFKNFDKK